jgi:hypothetical protein
VSQESKENSAQVIQSAKTYNSWIDAAVADFSKEGGFDNLKGKGKPLKLEEGDVLNSIMKNANILPPWVELRHEILKDMKEIIDKSEDFDFTIDENHIEQINQKILKYNWLVPNMLLQKGLITSQNIKTRYENWL